MFRFVYAWLPGDPSDDRLTTDGFVGVECDGERPTGIPCVGHRGPAVSPAVPPADVAGYIVRPAIAAGSPSEAGHRLSVDAEANGNRSILVENGGAFRTVWDLWTLLEAAHHPRVKLALDVDAARRAGETAAVLIPTLNLRIGLVRVRTPHNDLTGYAKRLAGIGFDGYVVLDPPPGEDRVPAAVALASVFRSVIPVKPVKKAPAPKPAVPKPANPKPAATA